MKSLLTVAVLMCSTLSFAQDAKFERMIDQRAAQYKNTRAVINSDAVKTAIQATVESNTDLMVENVEVKRAGFLNSSVQTTFTSNGAQYTCTLNASEARNIVRVRDCKVDFNGKNEINGRIK